MFLLHNIRLFFLTLTSIVVLVGCGSDNNENIEPVAKSSQIEVTEDEPKIAMMLAEDQDGDQLKFSIRNDPNEGKLTILNEVTGEFEYKPNDNFAGEDQFTFRVSDGESEANATVTIEVVEVNDAPQAVNDSYTLNEGASKGANLLDNDRDPDINDSLTLSVTPVQPPLHGELDLQPDGRFTYTHNGSETTSDSFVYKVTDSGGFTAQATVTLTINQMNDIPVADDDSARTNKGDTVDIDVLDGDNDPDGAIDASTINIVNHPGEGNATVVNGKVRYTPNSSFLGEDSFDYTVEDNSGALSNTARVTIIVESMGSPVATAGCSFAAAQTQQTSRPLEAKDADDIDVDAKTFKLGEFGEVDTGAWLNTAYGRVRIIDETMGTFEFELTNSNGLGKRDEFKFQVSVVNEAPDSATQSLVIEPRIMPLGDSITDGVTSGGGIPLLPLKSVRGGYRLSLYQNLVENDYKIDFVGTQNSGNGILNFDFDNEGYPGFRATEVANTVDSWTGNQLLTDIILLHVGTNNINTPAGQTLEEVADEVAANTSTSILAKINSWAYDNNTKVTVLLAKIIGFYNDDTLDASVSTFNALVVDLVDENRVQWPNINIQMVDQNSALTVEGDWATQQDSAPADKRFHPTVQGYEKMANRWSSALTPVLDSLCNE